MSRAISILGCGWLGLPLADCLIKDGWVIKGSTTTKEKLSVLKEKGITPFNIRIDEHLVGQDVASFFQTNILIITVPFRRDLLDPTQYINQIDKIIEHVETSLIDRVIFTSSTAVYPDHTGTVTEDSKFIADGPRAKALLEVEKKLSDNKNFKTTIIRLAGLYGGTRKIGMFLSGKKDISGGDAPVNLIHLEDSVNIIKNIIAKDIRGGVFNAVCDFHPTRRELYTQAALKLGLEKPTFKDEKGSSGKIVSNTKIKKYLNYQFMHPDPLRDI